MIFIKEVLAQHPRNPDTGTQFISINNAFGFGVFDSLGDFVNVLTPIVFSIAAMLVVFYFLIGAFELITSQGDKAHIVSARSKIYHSIIGFILLMALFLVMQYIIPALVPGTTLKIF